MSSGKNGRLIREIKHFRKSCYKKIINFRKLTPRQVEPVVDFFLLWFILLFFGLGLMAVAQI